MSCNCCMMLSLPLFCDGFIVVAAILLPFGLSNISIINDIIVLPFLFVHDGAPVCFFKNLSGCIRFCLFLFF